jgi:hypothetical protein
MMSPYRNFRSDEAAWAVQAISRWFLTVGILLGLSIVHGHRQRWSSPSFSTALTVPGAPESWGVAIIILSVIGLSCSMVGPKLFRVTAVGLGGVAVWYFFFAYSLLDVALSNPAASTTGVVTYSGCGVACSLLGVIYWRHARALHD